MAQCRYCSVTILFGAVTEGSKVFCSAGCRESERLLEQANRVPPDVILQKAAELHQGCCPQCRGPGPCDVHRTYVVWSFLLATRWKSVPQLSCRRCARRSQWKGLLSSLALGWWGVPWGVIITPLQVFRNLRALWCGTDPRQPSPELCKLVRVGLASRWTKKPPPPGERGAPAANGRGHGGAGLRGPP